MTEICTCDTPCCEADVGIGIITCESQHCPTHGIHAGKDPICFRCGRKAEDCPGYLDMADIQEDETPAGFVRRCEGTYNPDTNTFACDECYIAIGCPSRPGRVGWKAPARKEATGGNSG